MLKPSHSIFVTMSILVLIYSIISIYTQFACKHISVKFCDSSNETTTIPVLNVSSDFGQNNLKASVVKESVKEVHVAPNVAVSAVPIIRSNPDYDFDYDPVEVTKIIYLFTFL